MFIGFNESLKETNEKGEEMSTLNDRYRIHNKSKSNKSLLIYVYALIVLIFSATFSKYLSSSNGTFGLELANWCIKVNDVAITSETTTIRNEIDLIATEGASNDGKIKPGQKGYFDILIDPEYTEVSLQYKIVLDTSKLPSQIILTGYSINNSNQKINLSNNKTIEVEIYLDGKDSLNSLDKRKYRIYWEWPQDNAKIENIQQEYIVKANLEIKQIL